MAQIDSSRNLIPVKRALISVYDKTGLPDLVVKLAALGVQIFSTGSTAKRIAEAGVAVTPVEELTGFPECFDGRVKTLHPRVHGAILADRRRQTHRNQLLELSIEPFDLVICNLYPFAETVACGADFDGCVEQIDIGGPAMVRAAAKNHPSVAVVVDPGDYPRVVEAVQQGGFDLSARRELAAAAFAHTAEYDTQVAEWFAAQLELGEEEPSGHLQELPESVLGLYEKAADLRYGENPHQDAALYLPVPAEDTPAQAGLAEGVAAAVQLHGKAMSYNNYSDADAALRAAYDHNQPCVAIIKHANPCGIALGEDVAAAHRAAHACDPVSAFGGVIAVNRPVTVELARQITPIFTEVLLAPGYEDGALAVLQTKKNLRVLQVVPPARGGLEFRQISGGLLVQKRDDVDQDADRVEGWTLAAGAEADVETLADLEFAWRSVRAVKSNAVLLAKDRACVGIGMGQVNRVDSCRLAIERANTLGMRETGDAAALEIDSAGGARTEDVVAAQPPCRARGSVAASDAFFPFADGPQLLIEAGVKAIVQPGGSIRDQETLDLCEKAGVSVYLTGTRHFFH